MVSAPRQSPISHSSPRTAPDTTPEGGLSPHSSNWNPQPVTSASRSLSSLCQLSELCPGRPSRRDGVIGWIPDTIIVSDPLQIYINRRSRVKSDWCSVMPKRCPVPLASESLSRCAIAPPIWTATPRRCPISPASYCEYSATRPARIGAFQER